MTLSICNMPIDFSYAPIRSLATGMLVSPPRPPACTNPDTEISGYTAARNEVTKATSRRLALADDLAAAKLAALGTKDATRALAASVARGEKPAKHAAADLDHARQAQAATIALIEAAIERADADVAAARADFRQVLRRAGEDAIALMAREAGEARAMADAAKQKADVWSGWARDASFALRGSSTVDELLAFLSIGPGSA